VAEPASAAGADRYEFRDNADERRWEVTDGDELVAFAEYRLRPGSIAFTHTVVDPTYEGRGIGSRLAKTVLDDAVARELRIIPYCPFISAYLERHAEYAAHVDMPSRR
jgi:predicted GNAT family acetyltransferase